MNEAGALASLADASISDPSWRARMLADAVRALAASCADDPGLSLGMADVVTGLWSRAMKFDAADPTWPDRDRFVVSVDRGAPLHRALLQLTGQDSAAEDPAVTIGEPGQGLGMAIGLALAERLLAARFGRSLVDHRTWVVATDADLMKGIGHEAASLAGQLRLTRLAVLYDDCSPTESGSVDDVPRRFASYGWSVKCIDRHDTLQIQSALAFALRAKKPTLIACRAPSRPVGQDGAIRGRLEEAHARWRAIGSRGATARRSWLKRLARHPQRGEFERAVAGKLPEAWHESLAAVRAELVQSFRSLTTQEASAKALEALGAVIPELVSSVAGLPASVMPRAGPMGPVTSVYHYNSRYLHFGWREYGMAAALHGLALHGGVIPCGAARLVVSDYLRPALRLAAQRRRRAIFALIHGATGVVEDGPVAHLAALRAIPHLFVFRPADAVETAECWELAILRGDGPSVIALAARPVPSVRSDAAVNRCARGGYVLAEADGPRRATLIATGAEVAIAVAARAQLAEQGIAAAIVSLPCWELFALQDEAYQATVLGAAPRFGIEAAGGFGWERWLGDGGMFIGIDGFGAPADDLPCHFGLTPEAISAVVRKRLG